LTQQTYVSPIKAMRMLTSFWRSAVLGYVLATSGTHLHAGRDKNTDEGPGSAASAVANGAQAGGGLSPKALAPKVQAETILREKFDETTAALVRHIVLDATFFPPRSESEEARALWQHHQTAQDLNREKLEAVVDAYREVIAFHEATNAPSNSWEELLGKVTHWAENPL
jgi:hypothetical protein